MEKEDLHELLEKKQFKDIREITVNFKHDDPVAVYGTIIRKLMEEYPKLKEVSDILYSWKKGIVNSYKNILLERVLLMRMMNKKIKPILSRGYLRKIC